ncbi:hypothetical protein [Streptomyces sp. NPDC058382]|uniref:hypothetical protein n=1 Tax=unclassified Streptomyces TaxID=2593676 RepID=UPI00363D3827
MSAGSRGVLGAVGSAADGVEQLRTGLVEPAIALGWQVAVPLTPTAGRWLRANGELELLETLTGLPVRDTQRLPTEPRPQRELMQRMGHSSVRAALIYQHLVNGRDHAIAAHVDEQIRKARPAEPDDVSGT